MLVRAGDAGPATSSGRLNPAAHLDGEALGGVPASHFMVTRFADRLSKIDRQNFGVRGLQTCSDKVFRLSGWRDLTRDPAPCIGSVRTSPDVHFPKNKDFYLAFRWTDPYGGQNGGQTHSQTKQRGLVRSGCASPWPQ
jgi:hypothetical protein